LEAHAKKETSAPCADPRQLRETLAEPGDVHPLDFSAAFSAGIPCQPLTGNPFVRSSRTRNNKNIISAMDFPVNDRRKTMKRAKKEVTLDFQIL